MTKIKNTKKGMAKKTLSISLAVAMLATSNVPVWAAEDLFTDGAAVEAVEAPVEDLFTDDAEVVEEVVEAPVVEEEEVVEAKANSLVYDDSELLKAKADEWGTKIVVPTTGLVYKDGGKENDKTIKTSIIAYWTYNGKQIPGSSGTYDESELGLTMAALAANAPVPTKEQCIEGGSFELHMDVYANGKRNFSEVYNFEVAKPVDITTVLDRRLNGLDGAKKTVKFETGLVYDGTEKKSKIAYDNGKDFVCKYDDGNDVFLIEDFDWDYVRMVKGENNLVDSSRKILQLYGNDGSVSVTAKVTKPGYTGSAKVDKAYIINQKTLTETVAEKDLKITSDKDVFEYTGGDICPSVENMTVIDTETGDDLTKCLLATERSGDKATWINYIPTPEFPYDYGIYFNVTESDDRGYASLVDDYNYNVGPNYRFFEASENFKIAQRDLNNCYAVVKDFSKGELDTMIRNHQEFVITRISSNKDKAVTLYSKDGERLHHNALVDRLVATPSYENGKYYVTVKARNSADDQVINVYKAEIDAPDISLRAYKPYLVNADGTVDTSHPVNVDNVSVAYTGKPYYLPKDSVVLYNAAAPADMRTVTSSLYDFVYDERTDAGVGSIKVVGKGNYSGSSIVMNYEIRPAEVVDEESSAAKKVVYNADATNAPEVYADAMDVIVKAVNDAMDNRPEAAKADDWFTLTADDMKVTYEYVGSEVDADGDKNMVGNYVRATVKVTNPNFLGNPTGIDEAGKAYHELTFDSEIVKPSIGDELLGANVEVLNPDSYVFNGKEIIPEVKVTTKDGTVLKAGTDYKLEVLHGKHAGQAEVIITALDKDVNGDGKADGKYENGTVKTGTFFTIQKANVADLSLKDNDATYTGEKIYLREDNKSTMNVVLADAMDEKAEPTNVTDMFNVPKTTAYKNNVNAGTATVTVTVKDEWKGDFTEDTTDLTFTISPVEITKANAEKGEFTVYGANGHVIDFRAFEGFTYDGTAHTFKDADYDSVGVKLNGKDYTLEKGKDYTIEYADNVYPDQTDANKKSASVYAKLSSNFVVVDNKNTDSKTDDVITDKLAEEFFRINKVAFAKTDVAVSNPVYNLGKKVEPTVVVTVDGKTLVEDEDYTVSYNKDAAYTAGAENTVTVTGKNGYVDSTFTYDWTVAQKSLKADDIEVILDKTSYKPGEEPEVTVVDGKTIIDVEEYTVAYTDKEAGKLTITAADKNYTDEIEVTYEVAARANLEDATIIGVPTEVEATGEQITPAIRVRYENTILTEGEDYTVTYGENTEVGEGTVTITAVEGSVDYTGTKTVTFNIVAPAPEVGQAMIDKVEVVNNRATVILTGEASDAEGYDYVISTVEDYKNGRLTNGINKNQVATQTTYQYLDRGVYYAYCHAWKRDENGKKVFGEWSNIERFEINVDTPSQPVITDFTVEGNTVTVNYKGSADALGYDVVLGSTYGKVYGEKRPLQYGDKVIKNAKGFSVTFTDVEPGTYYAGLHAYNRTAADSKKVFSPWSNIKTITVE